MLMVLPSGVELAYHVRGEGPPLVLLAGTGYAAATWPPTFVNEMASRFTVITLDYRGVGRTPGTDGLYSTRLFAADVLALLRGLHTGPVDLLGHSMGGRVAQWVALDGPEFVRSLVLAASGPGAWREPRPLPIPIEVAVELAEHGYEGYIRRQIARTFFTPEFMAGDRSAYEWLAAAFWEHRPPLREYLKHVVARQQHNSVARLADIRHPTLVLVGDRDTHVGGTGSHVEQSEYLAAHIPNAQLDVIPGVAHGYFWQCPTETAARISRFLMSR